ncbi:hypothetical protein PUN28_016884 [Cardiocondyla obscurior]|uniref:Protein kinase C-binding protein 1 n=2 Tax=Cardiocondyla obscurior TaxID=286306 RepID=A0AAW2ERC0_9HYME
MYIETVKNIYLCDTFFYKLTTNFLLKVIKMASNKNREDSVASPITDKIDKKLVTKINEKRLPTTSPKVDQNEEMDDTTANVKKKNLTLNAADDSTSVQKDNSDNIKNENKDDLRSLTIDKNKDEDNSKTDEKREAKTVTLLSDQENVDEKKEIKSEDDKGSLIKESITKRKRKTSNNPIESTSENSSRNKRKKIKVGYDQFCWRCHKDKVDTFCTACPRSWHRKCIGGIPPSVEKWICGECVVILKAENAETRSIAMTQLSIDQLCTLLAHVVERLREHTGAEPFCKPVNLVEVPNYLDYVIKPMDLSLLESNVRSKLYGSTDAFMADAKWMQHNCIVFNTCGGVYADTSRLTNTAKQLIKVARQEVSEIEACPDCYAHSRNLLRSHPLWFIEPCRRPHPLVWAKLKGFPYWPAKAMSRINSQGYVDVRFFGEHDRAWVSPRDLYLYSEDPPAPSPRKRKNDMDDCMLEITRHCRKLTLMFGQFKFAPPKIQYDPNDPMQIQLMLPNYNPLEPNNLLPMPEISPVQKKKSPQKKRNLRRSKSQSDESTNIQETENDSKNENHEKEIVASASKVQELDSDVKDTSNSQPSLNGTHTKINEKVNQESVIKSTPQKVAQNKTIKEKSKTSPSRLNVSDNTTENNTASPNTSNSEKNSLQKAKNNARLSKALAKFVAQTATESLDTPRTSKRSLLKNIINPQLISQTENSKTVLTKSTKNSRTSKPRTKTADKLNLEKESKNIPPNKENEKLPSLNAPASQTLLLKNDKEASNVQKPTSEIDIKEIPFTTSNTSVIQAIPTTNSIMPAGDKSVLLLVVNGKPEPTKQITPAIDQGNKNVFVTNEGSHLSPNKARKSFPNKSHPLQSVQCLLPGSGEIIEDCPDKDTLLSYQLAPPEAGPISARLHHDAHDLARRMGQMMEEAYKAAAQDNVSGENGANDNYQATIFFLRMQIEHMKWQHQQQLTELKHNADRTLREVRASLEAEKLRCVEEARREIEEEKNRCIEETKRKQWCAMCGREAMFYCCWNTAYCNYPCQQSHWTVHMQTCSQKPTYATSSTNLNPQQVMPKLALSGSV